MTQRAVNGRELRRSLRFGVLGPVRALDGDRLVALGGTKQRGVLAMLLLDAGRPVSVDRIVSGLWEDEPPATAQKMVQLYVSRLRKELGAKAIRTTARGYELEIGASQLDLDRFRELVEGSRATANVDPSMALDRLREALALWRGEALADVASEPFARVASPSLEELRLAALEVRVDLELELGLHAELVPELEALVAQNPLRERLRGQLMLALYRSGRQADALGTFREGRRELVEKLGLDPSPALQRLESAILRQDPELELPRRAKETVTTESEAPLARSGRSRKRIHAFLLALAAAVVAAAASAAYALFVRGRAEVQVAPSSVAVIAAGSSNVVDDVKVGGDPGSMAVGAGGVWVGSRDDRTIVRIDPRTRKIEQTYGLPYQPQRLAVARSTVAVANGYSGTISTINTRLSFLSEPKRLRGPTRGKLRWSEATESSGWASRTDRSVLSTPTPSQNAAPSPVSASPARWPSAPGSSG